MAWCRSRGSGIPIAAAALAAWLLSVPAWAVELPGETPGGEFAVSDMGAATYRIPLQIPPGTAGMLPELSLAYSSQGDNGILGVGWGLGGLSLMHRCPTTLATDGVYGGITFTASDQFCLDGDRLVLVSGVPGQDGAEYRGEKEIFAKVIAKGAAGTGPQWFEVWTKAGRILEYGSAPDARLSASGRPEVETWHLNKVRDRVGSYYTISYVQDAANGFVRPERFDYTGNAGANPVLNPYASVRFVYEDRPDAAVRYAFGGAHAVTKRMTKVQTFLESALVRECRLAYAAAAGPRPSRLETITECAANGDCLRPTTLAWTSSGLLAWSLRTGGDLSYDANTWWLSGDVQGDGRTDAIAIRNNAGNVQIVVFKPLMGGAYTGMYVNGGITDPPGLAWQSDDQWLAGDVDADGRTDVIVVRRIDSFSSALRVFHSAGDGTFSLLAPATTIPPPSSPPFDSPTYMTADRNGDGRADFIRAVGPRRSLKSV